MGMKSMYELRDMLCKELDELIRKGELGAGDLDIAHKLTDTIKNIDKIEMLEADGYSNNGDWEARGSYDGMYRDDRYSRRGRDMRGRYSRHDGTDKRLMDELEELMRTIEPGKRDVIRRALEELKEA